MSYRCLIVDDERPALSLLTAYIAKLPQLELVQSCESGTDALHVLQSTPIDILFLDIQMPDLTGLELLQTLPRTPQVVMTTAYRDYAVEGFALNVTDYLVKPFSFDRFVQAVNRAIEQHGLVQQSGRPPESGEAEAQVAGDHFFVRTGHRIKKVRYQEVHYVESMREYVRIHAENKRYMVHQTMSSMEKRLSMYGFIRVHRSFLVNLEYLDSLQGNRIFIGETEIPIGGNYKKALFDRIELL
ncbi:MAG: LytTR family DNA-binding domain-containing protein [Bacteroidota bacterium]